MAYNYQIKYCDYNIQIIINNKLQYSIQNILNGAMYSAVRKPNTALHIFDLYL